MNSTGLNIYLNVSTYKGFKIADYTGKNWLTFTYDIDATHYFSDKQGFLGNYSLGKLMRIMN